MSTMLIDILFGVTMAVAGAVSVLLCRGYTGRRTSRDAPVDVRRAREVMARLHQWTLEMADDMDEHSSRVGKISQELASETMPDTDVVVAAVAKIFEANERISQRLISAEEKLQEQAELIESQAVEVRTDMLTRLANRRGFDDEMARRHAEFRRHGTPVSVVVVDLDHFKTLNDTHGHQAGDEVLRGVAGVFRRILREVDLAARCGGDEFAIILPHTVVEDACTVAERVREAIEQACFRFEGKYLSVTASLGVAQLRPSERPSPLLRRADEALYASKRDARNDTHWHDGRVVHPARVGERAATSPHEGSQRNRDERPTAVPSDPPVNANEEHATLRNDSTTEQSECLPSQLEQANIGRPRPKSPPETHNEIPAIAVNSQVDAVPRPCDRTAFCQIIRRRLAEWERGGESWSLILAEPDNCEAILSRRGADATERVRQVVGHALGSVIREMDLMARYTANRFAFMLPGTEGKQLIIVAERLHQAVAGCGISNEDEAIEITLSLGLTQVTEGDDLVRLLRRAEEALCCVKEAGGNGSYYHNGQWPEPVIATAGVADQLGF